MCSAPGCLGQRDPAAALGSDGRRKRAKTVSQQSKDTWIVEVSDLLVWPVGLEPGASHVEGPAGRLPFSVLHYLLEVHNIDLSHPTFSFADRCREFFSGMHPEGG